MDSAANLDLVVLDRDPVWTESLRLALDPLGRKVRAATDPGEALRLVEDGKASLLVVDAAACCEGMDWIRNALESVEGLRVIVVAAEADAAIASIAFAAGASAVVIKSSTANDLVSALTVAAAADRETATERLGLTDREVELLNLIARGSSNAEIARTLWVSQQTVKAYLTTIYKKLGVGSRTEAVWEAQSQGVFDLPRRD